MGAREEKRAQPLIEALRGVLCQLAEPTQVLGAILDQSVKLTGAGRGLLVEVADHGDMAFRVLRGFEPQHLEGEAGRFSRRLCGRVIETGSELLLDNVISDPIYGEMGSVRALKVCAILCVPIHANGRIAALIHLEHQRRGHFTREHVELMRSLVEFGGPILESLRAGRQIIQDREQLRISETRYRGEAEESRKLLASEWSFGRFVGRSDAVHDLELSVHKAAATEFPVLIVGETGTGKGILARVLHYGGPRAEGPMITVFCPSLERGMVEAELFGHRRGAFTGASGDRLGKVQAAEKGTLFLDEIGELPAEFQPKLLRLLQERTFERIGDPEERRADVRLIAATNRDLEQEVRAGRFRRDLYERLNFIPIRVPPLRERIEDLGLLLRHCLDQTDSGRWIELSPEATEFLTELDFSWPGNVRHIEQLAARLTTEGLRGQVTADHVSRLLGRRASEPGAVSQPDESSPRAGLEAGLPELLSDAERMWLENALRHYPDLTRAELAARLKISESALYKKLRQYQLGG